MVILFPQFERNDSNYLTVYHAKSELYKQKKCVRQEKAEKNRYVQLLE